MNITKYNYKKSLPLIIQTIHKSDFIAFDFEFSGVQYHQDLANHQTDSIPFRYWKYRENVSKFMPTQIGICGFKYEEPTKTLHCFPFNFYILPFTKDKLSLDKVFSVSMGSFDFLAQNSFDFNKLFYESVGYMSHHDYEKYQTMQKMKNQQEKMIESSFNDSPDCLIFCNSKFLLIKNWLDTIGKDIKDIEKDERNLLKIDISFTRAKLFNSLIKNLPKMFPNQVLDSEIMMEEGSNEMFLGIRKSSLELRQRVTAKKEREDKYKELQRFLFAKNIGLQNADEALKKLLQDNEWQSKHNKFSSLTEQINLLFQDPARIQKTFEENKEDELIEYLASKVIDNQPSLQEDALGFTRVLDFISHFKKPMITHNGILDLMHVYDKFYRPLPETVMEFKTGINTVFPHIYDSKHMINSRQQLQQVFPNSSLSEAYLRIGKPDFQFDQQIKINPSFNEYSLTSTVYHEAGFDSLMTGAIWFKIMTLLNKDRVFPGIDSIVNSDQYNSMDKNKIPMASIKVSFNIGQPTKEQSLPTDSKSFVFVLQNVPIYIDSEVIQQLLYEKLKTDIKIYRVYNKDYVFFTVFGKESEDMMHLKLQQSNDGLIIEDTKGESKMAYKVISYQRYESELRQKIEEQNRIKDILPDYIWLLNQKS